MVSTGRTNQTPTKTLQPDSPAALKEHVREGVLVLGNLQINFDIFQVRVGANEVRLGRQEFELLTSLVHNRNTVLPYEELLLLLWDDPVPAANRRLITLVHRLRAKLSGMYPYQLSSVRGVGYGIVDSTWFRDLHGDPPDDPARPGLP
jgi:DNA-binding response OmpR family regulator